MMPMEYLAPKTLDQLFQDLQGKGGQVKFVAGCTNVIPDLRARAVSPMFLEPPGAGRSVRNRGGKR